MAGCYLKSKAANVNANAPLGYTTAVKIGEHSPAIHRFLEAAHTVADFGMCTRPPCPSVASSHRTQAFAGMQEE